jgi:hypothetical protein
MDIAPVTLPSGATVTFRDPEDLLGEDVEAVLATLRREQSETGQAVSAIAGVASVLVESWTIPYPPGRPKDTTDEAWPLPRTDPALLGKLSARDWRALIDVVSPAVRLVLPSAPDPTDVTPGSPTVPAGG